MTRLNRNSFLFVLFVIATISFMISCGGGNGGTPPPPPPDPTVTSVTVAPASANVETGGKTAQFTADPKGTGNFDRTVNWFVNNIMSGDGTVGTIDISGKLTSPNAMPNPGTVTVKACSRQKGFETKCGTASVIYTLPPAPPEIIAFYRMGPKYDFENCGGSCEDIWSMKRDGTDLRQLTTDPHQDFYPIFSPDGRLLAFVTHRDGDTAIYIMDSDGGNQRRLNTGTDYSRSPAWSPDGKYIVFIGRYNDYMGVAVIELSTGKVVQLTQDAYCPPNSSCNIPDHPSWSPDGKKIVYATPNAEIYVMESDGKNPTNLTNTADAKEGYPGWSPDGQFIVFHSNANGHWEIYVMTANGADPRKLTDTLFPPDIDPTNMGATSPVWSPDGTTILFIRYVVTTAMYTIKADGSEEEKILPNSPSAVGYPTWTRVK